LAPSSRDRISVDLQGLGAGLSARASAERVGVSEIVRRAVARELKLQPELLAGVASVTMRLSIRLTREEVAELDALADRAGLSRSAYLSGLLARVPAIAGASTSRPDLLAALHASCAELSTLSRNLHHLAALLRQGQVRAALEYREVLRRLEADVRSHLELAAGALAELRPARPSAVVPAATPRQR
jgi:hypothetical protein